MAAWAIVGLAVSLLGTAASAYSSYQQGKDAAAMASLNAKIAADNASLEAQKLQTQKTLNKVAEQRLRKEGEKLKSAQRVAYSKSGVDPGSGSPLLTIKETASDIEMDAQTLRLAGSMEEANIVAQRSQYKIDEKMALMRGSQAKTAGTIGAGSSLLSGIGQFAAYKAG